VADSFGQTIEAEGVRRFWGEMTKMEQIAKVKISFDFVNLPKDFEKSFFVIGRSIARSSGRKGSPPPERERNPRPPRAAYLTAKGLDYSLRYRLFGHLSSRARMLKFEFHIPELDQLPAEKSEAVLKGCLESAEFSRRTRRVRIISFGVYAILVLAPPWLVHGPLAKTQTQGVIYTVLAFLGLLVVLIVVLFYMHPRILRRLIKERLRDV